MLKEGGSGGGTCDDYANPKGIGGMRRQLLTVKGSCWGSFAHRLALVSLVRGSPCAQVSPGGALAWFPWLCAGVLGRRTIHAVLMHVYVIMSLT